MGSGANVYLILEVGVGVRGWVGLGVGARDGGGEGGRGEGSGGHK